MDWPKREKREGSGKFLSLKDGDSIKGLFRGEPSFYSVVWENGKSRECDPNEKGARDRFRINFVYRENGAMTCKVLNFPASLADTLEAYDREYEGLHKLIVSIKRTGMGKETRYQIFPAKEGLANEEFLKQVEAVQVHELDTKKSTSRDVNGDPVFTEDEIPF